MKHDLLINGTKMQYIRMKQDIRFSSGDEVFEGEIHKYAMYGMSDCIVIGDRNLNIQGAMFDFLNEEESRLVELLT